MAGLCLQAIGTAITLPAQFIPTCKVAVSQAPLPRRGRTSRPRTWQGFAALSDPMNPVLTRRQQGIIVAGLGAAGLFLAILVLAGARGMSQPGTCSGRAFPAQ